MVTVEPSSSVKVISSVLLTFVVKVLMFVSFVETLDVNEVTDVFVAAVFVCNVLMASFVEAVFVFNVLTSVDNVLTVESVEAVFVLRVETSD